MMVPVGEQGLALPGTILVVEDDHDVRVAVRNTLEDEGYRVLSVTDGRHALDLLERNAEQPSLILLDLMLPLMDGWEFATRLHSIERLRDIPVAVISALDASPPPGMVTFLRKPVRPEELLRLAERYCRRW